MEKNTAEIVKELGLCPDFKTFYHENKDYMVSQKLTELLAQLLETKGLKKRRSSKMRSFPKSTATRSFPVSVFRSGRSCCAWLWL